VLDRSLSGLRGVFDGMEYVFRHGYLVSSVYNIDRVLYIYIYIYIHLFIVTICCITCGMIMFVSCGRFRFIIYVTSHRKGKILDAYRVYYLYIGLVNIDRFAAQRIKILRSPTVAWISF